MTHRRVGAILLCLLAAGPVSGCRERPRPERGASGIPPVPATTVPVDSATAARYARLEPGMLGAVQAMPVEGWAGPGARPFEVARRSAVLEAGHAREFGRVTLPIALRAGSAALSQYPCTSCHAGPRLVMGKERIRDAHNNIQPRHPEQAGAACSTCHAEENVETLALRGGGRATLDESYRLCAQCHFQQAKAWAGGAHGKRLDGWEGRRVVLACTDCHDPHRPALQPQIPFRAPQLHRTGSPRDE